MKNIIYNTEQIKKYYSSSRQRWDDFYPSEQWVFKRIASKQPLGNVLDIGCACGGLGKALHEKFRIDSYTGIEINKDAILWARQNLKIGSPTRLMCDDFVKVNLKKQFDTVISLSCADWNIQTEKIITRAWQRVKPGGYFVISLRTTPGKGVNNIKKSYQYIDFFGEENTPEIANYVVFNFKDSLRMFKDFFPRPELIGAYGYWGKPSSTSVTPFKELVFVVFYIKKYECVASREKTRLELNLPLEVLADVTKKG